MHGLIHDFPANEAKDFPGCMVWPKPGACPSFEQDKGSLTKGIPIREHVAFRLIRFWVVLCLSTSGGNIDME